MIGRNTPAPTVPDAITLQWANGKTMARSAAAPRFAPFIGWHIEHGKDARLDELLAAAEVAQVEIKHQRPGGAEVVRHWDLGPRIEFLPITAGPVASSIAASLSNGNAKQTADAGIGLRWGEGERSRMALRGFVRGLWKLGYRGLLQLSTRSRMTDYLLAALLDHTRVAAAADDLVDRAKHPNVVSLAELWFPLGPGDDTDFGSQDTTTVTPIESGHPADVTREYLRTIWAGDELAGAAWVAWPLVKAWAMEFQAGTTGDGLGPADVAQSAPADEPPHPGAAPALPGFEAPRGSAFARAETGGRRK